jgi:hypothetical protein
MGNTPKTILCKGCGAKVLKTPNRIYCNNNCRQRFNRREARKALGYNKEEAFSINIIEGEIWRSVVGYEGHYIVSNIGNVVSLGRFVLSEKIFGRQLYPKYLKFQKKQGYDRVTLSVLGKKRTFGIHQLVAMAFISNPDNKATVNHINGIKTDNRVENLEWATNSENMAHAWATGLYNNTRKPRKKRTFISS